MYLQHFGLKRVPFSLESDPDFFWPGGGPAAALRSLQLAFAENHAFALLTGDPGSGKTVLLNRFRRDLAAHVDVAAVPNPALDLSDLYRIVFSELNMGSPPNAVDRARTAFRNALYAARGARRRVVVLVDEAQRMPTELLRELAGVSRQASGGPLFNTVLAGQTGFADGLAEQDRVQVFGRLSTRHHLGALTDPEVPAYIRHRLKTAGAEQDLFQPDALKAVGRFGAGLPRVINLLCDHALLTGYTAGDRSIGPEIVARCAGELGLVPAGPVPVVPAQRGPETVSRPETRLRRAGWGLAVALLAAAGAWIGIHPLRMPDRGPPPPRTMLAELPREAPPETDPAAAELPVPGETAPPAARPDAPPARASNPVSPAEPRVLTAPLSAVVSEVLPEEHLPTQASPPPETSVDANADAAPEAFRIAFRPESAEIEPASYESLRRLADLLDGRPGTRLAVQSLAVPTSKYAGKLFEFRVSALKSFLAGSSKKGAPVRLRAAPPASLSPSTGGSSLLEVRVED